MHDDEGNHGYSPSKARETPCCYRFIYVFSGGILLTVEMDYLAASPNCDDATGLNSEHRNAKSVTFDRIRTTVNLSYLPTKNYCAESNKYNEVARNQLQKCGRQVLRIYYTLVASIANS